MNNYFQYLLGNDAKVTSSRQEDATPGVIVQKDSKKKSIPKKFQEDVKVLKKHFGSQFSTGLSIDITLQDALSIMPKERRRIDSYASLIKYLQKNEGITLIITSNKTKS